MPVYQLTLAEHVERGIVTLILANRPGLELFDQSTEQWVPAPTDDAGGPLPVVLVGHTLEFATANMLKACRHRVRPDGARGQGASSSRAGSSRAGSSSSASSGGGGGGGGGDQQRLSVSFQVRARSDATMDQARVPPALRRVVVPRSRIVQEEMVRFAQDHSSVNGHGGHGGGGAAEGKRESDEDEEGRPSKRPRTQSSSHELSELTTIRVRYTRADPHGDGIITKMIIRSSSPSGGYSPHLPSMQVRATSRLPAFFWTASGSTLLKHPRKMTWKTAIKS